MLTSPSGKAYIGQTICPIEERLKKHQMPSSGCKAISRAIKKYGWENFKKEWYKCPDEDLNFDEELLVEKIGTLAPNGYNLKEGGGSKGKPSEETKKKMSEAHTGNTHTKETKQKLSEAPSGEKNPMYGKTHGDETKQKLSEAKTGEKNPNYGKTRTTETKKKMSEALSGEKHPSSKKVYQYTIDGTLVDSFGSSEEAARALGKENGSSICKCARGELKSAYGFKWSYTVVISAPSVK